MFRHRSAITNTLTDTPSARRFLATFAGGTQKAGYPHLPILLFRPSEAFLKERTESEYPRRSVYNAPRKVCVRTLLCTVSPRHTPGVYTTPVAFTSAFVFVQDLSFRRSNSQKQSINDAFQYVAVQPSFARRRGYERCKITNKIGYKPRFPVFSAKKVSKYLECVLFVLEIIDRVAALQCCSSKIDNGKCGINSILIYIFIYILI